MTKINRASDYREITLTCKKVIKKEKYIFE
jgi:hypothetical protein